MYRPGGGMNLQESYRPAWIRIEADDPQKIKKRSRSAAKRRIRHANCRPTFLYKWTKNALLKESFWTKPVGQGIIVSCESVSTVHHSIYIGTRYVKRKINFNETKESSNTLDTQIVGDFFTKKNHLSNNMQETLRSPSPVIWSSAVVDYTRICYNELNKSIKTSTEIACVPGENHGAAPRHCYGAWLIVDRES
jgi:hypothetical protein